MYKSKLVTASLLAAIALSACNEDSADEESEEGEDNVSNVPLYGEVNTTGTVFSENDVATSPLINGNGQWGYFDMDANAVVERTDNWQIAVQGTDVYFNDTVEVALLAEQADFYEFSSNNYYLDNGYGTHLADETTITSATADSELEHLLTEYVLTDDLFTTPSDGLLGNGDEEIWDYDFVNHVLYANDDVFWSIQSTEGDAYAKVRITELYNAADAAYTNGIFELYIQGAADATFSDTPVTWTVPITANIASACYDIDTNAEIDCSNETEWDIHFNFDLANGLYQLDVNSGAVYGSQAAEATLAFPAADIASYTSAVVELAEGEVAGDFELIGSDYNTTAQSSIVEDEYFWYTYNVTGNNIIWPNYRVYAVRDSALEKTFYLQILNYYDEAGTSRQYTVRTLEVEDSFWDSAAE